VYTYAHGYREVEAEQACLAHGYRTMTLVCDCFCHGSFPVTVGSRTVHAVRWATHQPLLCVKRLAGAGCWSAGRTKHASYYVRATGRCGRIIRPPFAHWKVGDQIRGVWREELKFNKYCSTFVLFDKKFLILD
jgi:hypothetical protein